MHVLYGISRLYFDSYTTTLAMDSTTNANYKFIYVMVKVSLWRFEYLIHDFDAAAIINLVQFGEIFMVRAVTTSINIKKYNKNISTLTQGRSY